MSIKSHFNGHVGLVCALINQAQELGNKQKINRCLLNLLKLGAGSQLLKSFHPPLPELASKLQQHSNLVPRPPFEDATIFLIGRKTCLLLHCFNYILFIMYLWAEFSF